MNAPQTGSIIAFYHRQNLCLGIITGHEKQAHRVETSEAESILLNHQRIILHTSEPVIEGSAGREAYHSVLSQFIMSLEEAADHLDPLTIREHLLAEHDFISLEQAFRIVQISDDVRRFACLRLIKDHPELFVFKHNLLRSRTPAETEEYWQKRSDAEKDGERRRQMTILIARILSGGTPDEEPSMIDNLLAELKQALIGSRTDGIIALIRSVDSSLNMEERIRRLRLALGDITAQTDGTTALSGLPVCFTSELSRRQFSHPRFLPHRVLEERFTFSIDDESTRDIDDAFSWMETADGYELGIHITDLTTLIDAGDAVWQEALLRVSSLYLPTEEIPMLPPLLAWQRGSLCTGEMRPCLSLILRLDPELQVTQSDICLNLIRIDRRYTYLEVDDSRAKEPFKQLFYLANAIRQKRQPEIRGGDNLIYNTVVDGGIIRLTAYDPDGPARSMVAELMVLYNQSLAEYAKDHQIPLIYRNIQSVEITDDDGVSSITSSAYHATSPKHHPGINSPAYAHLTSPIRRCIDLINQAQITAFYRQRPFPCEAETLEALIPYIENRLDLIRRTVYESQRYWFLRYLQKNHLYHPINLRVIKYKRGICTADLMPWRKRISIRTENAPPKSPDNQIIITKIDPEKRLVNGYFL